MEFLEDFRTWNPEEPEVDWGMEFTLATMRAQRVEDPSDADLFLLMHVRKQQRNAELERAYEAQGPQAHADELRRIFQPQTSQDK